MPDAGAKYNSLTMEERPLGHAEVQGATSIDTAVTDRFAAHPQVHGRVKRLVVRTGLNITAFDLHSAGTFRGFASSEPCLAIVVLMDCSGSSRVTSPGCNRPLEFSYTPETIYFFARTAVSGEFAVPPGTNIKGVEIRASLETLRRLQALDLFANVDADHSYCRVANSDIWIGGIPTPGAISARAAALIDAALGSDGYDLEVEANGLAILTAALEAMRSHGHVRGMRQRRLSAALDLARKTLADDMARAWTVAELAQAVQLSERQLKAGFRARFGTPVYEFLQSTRLTRARALLEAGNLTITDVALAVGYANPSHFAFLFRRTFGAPPSQMAGRGKTTTPTPLGSRKGS